MTLDPPACVVCGEALAEPDVAQCNNCDRYFHLRARQDSTTDECGEVWINEQYLSLEFACFICLGRVPEPGSAEPPVARGH